MRFSSRFVAGVAAAIVLGLSFVASPARAECNPDDALFEDEFDFMDISWGESDSSLYVEDGVFVINSFGGIVNFSTKNEGSRVCVDMKIAEASDVPSSPIGIVFWWQDWDNYYSMFYWADGWIEVRRIYKGQMQALFTEETLALKKGVGETNRVELRLKPKDATIFINGTEIKRFKGKQPKDGGVIGLYGTSPEDKPAKFEFDNFVVNELADSEE